MGPYSIYSKTIGSSLLSTKLFEGKTREVETLKLRSKGPVGVNNKGPMSEEMFWA